MIYGYRGSCESPLNMERKGLGTCLSGILRHLKDYPRRASSVL